LTEAVKAKIGRSWTPERRAKFAATMAAKRGDPDWKANVSAGTQAGMLAKAERDHGLCSRCNKHPAEPNKKLCASCIVYCRDRDAEERLLVKAVKQDRSNGSAHPELVRLIDEELAALTKKVSALRQAREALTSV
jgi:ribosomal protein L37E